MITVDEFNRLLSLLGAFGTGAAIAGFLVFLLLKSFIPSYLSKKAENLATREDVAAITDEIERVRSEYSVLVEEFKAKHQLRMAALDRRLQAHQEAFALWRELLSAVHTDDVGQQVIKCQDWWEKNCLYLEPKVRESFVSAYSAANTHGILLRARSNANEITENWKQLADFPNFVFAAIQLPTLTEAESTPIKIELAKSAATG